MEKLLIPEGPEENELLADRDSPVMLLSLAAQFALEVILTYLSTRFLPVFYFERQLMELFRGVCYKEKKLV